MEISEAEDNLDGSLFTVAALAADMAAHQRDQRRGSADFSVIASVRERSFGNCHDGIAVWSAGMVRHSLARCAPCVF